MKKVICGVEFSEGTFRAVENSVESVKIEGFIPSKESMQDIADLLSGDTTIESLAKKHRDKSNEVELFL